MVFLTCCWIILTSVLLKAFTSIFIRNSFSVLSIILTLELRWFLSCQLFWIIWNGPELILYAIGTIQQRILWYELSSLWKSLLIQSPSYLLILYKFSLSSLLWFGRLYAQKSITVFSEFPIFLWYIALCSNYLFSLFIIHYKMFIFISDSGSSVFIYFF